MQQPINFWKYGGVFISRTSLERTFENIGSKGISVIIDPAVKKENGALRNTPLLTACGISLFTYPFKWHQMIKHLQIEKYEYFHSEGKEKILEKMILKNEIIPFVVFTNQLMENEYYSVGELANMANAKGIPAVFVVDNKDFTLRGGLRPLIEEDQVRLARVLSFNDWFYDFREVISEVFKLEFNSSLPIHLIEAAAFMKFVEGKVCTTEDRIFEEMIKAPYLPIWNSLSSIGPYEESTNLETRRSAIDALLLQTDFSKTSVEKFITLIQKEGNDVINRDYANARLLPKYKNRINEMEIFIKSGHAKVLKNFFFRPINKDLWS